MIARRQTGAESPYTFKTTIINTASQWTLEYAWPAMTHPNAEVLQAWLDSLKGQVGSFLYTPRQAYSSALTGRTLARAAYAYNDTIAVAGWSQGAPSTLRSGQMMQVGAQLLRIITASSVSDGNGVVTISFEPSLRVDYAANVPVVFQAPKGTFRLATSETPSYTLNSDKLCEFGTISAREVVE